MDFNEFKENITSPDWKKIGSKLNCPDLSIFSDEIKKSLQNGVYESNKNYFFDDENHGFKIQSLLKDDKPFFNIFAKSNIAVEVPVVKSKKKFNYTTKFDTSQAALVIAIAVVLVGLIIFSGPILKAFGV